MTTTLPTAPGTARPTPRRRLMPEFRYRPVLATLALLIVIYLVAAFRYEGFTAGQVVLNLLVNNTYLIVLAVGMTFVILTGGIDLSVGAVLALTTMVTAQLLKSGWSPAVVVPLTLVIGATIGLLIGVMVHYFEIQPFIASLAAMFFARGICYVISTESIPINNPLFTDLAKSIHLWGGLRITPGVLISLAVVAIAFFVLHYTRFGRTVYAIGSGDNSAELMGLRVGRTKVMVYVICGLCAALAGLLFTLYLPSGNSLHGLGMELDAIAAVVIGGTLLLGGYGFVLGSLLGVLVLGIIKTAINFEGNLSSWWTKIVTGVLLLIFIVLQRVMTLRKR